MLENAGSERSRRGCTVFGRFDRGTPQSNESFAGLPSDSATSLNYADQRWYSSQFGRFMTSDPGTGDPRNPQSFNRYAYAHGDPVNRTDPTGKGDGDGPPVDPCDQDPSNCFGDIGSGDGAFSPASNSVRYNTPYCGILYLEGAPNTSEYNVCWEGLPGSGVCIGNDFQTHPGCPAPPATPPTPPPPNAPPPPPCSISLFTRGVPFPGSPGNHTYVDVVDPSTNTNSVLEAGPTRHPILPTGNWGTLQARDEPVVFGQLISLGGTNPAKDRNLLTDIGGWWVCDEVNALVDNVDSYMGGPQVLYAPLPNGKTTFNSNSFTYTLVNQAGLSGYSPQLALGWTPGWGQLVPGL
jgi:RHS repeat-associated protein